MNLRGFQITAHLLSGLANWNDEPKEVLDYALGDKLAEEVGELAKACRRHGRTITLRPDLPSGDQAAVADEVGDVLFVLARRAHLHGVDLGMAAERVVAKIIERLQAAGKAATVDETLESVDEQAGDVDGPPFFWAGSAWDSLNAGIQHYQTGDFAGAIHYLAAARVKLDLALERTVDRGELAGLYSSKTFLTETNGTQLTVTVEAGLDATQRMVFGRTIGRLLAGAMRGQYFVLEACDTLEEAERLTGLVKQAKQDPGAQTVRQFGLRAEITTGASAPSMNERARVIAQIGNLTGEIDALRAELGLPPMGKLSRLWSDDSPDSHLAELAQVRGELTARIAIRQRRPEVLALLNALTEGRPGTDSLMPYFPGRELASACKHLTDACRAAGLLDESCSTVTPEGVAYLSGDHEHRPMKPLNVTWGPDMVKLLEIMASDPEPAEDSELIDAMGNLEAPAVCDLIALAEENGLLEREDIGSIVGPGPTHGRVKGLVLADKGREVLAAGK